MKTEIYFKEGCDLRTIKTDNCDLIKIEDGFLRAHDPIDDCWHCYNLDIIAHFHHPDKWRKNK